MIRRRKPLSPSRRKVAQSGTSHDRRVARLQVVVAASRRDGFRCVARDLVPEITCVGPLDPDEIRSRARGGDPLDLANVQMLCRAHHDWKHTHDPEAVALGLSRHSWDDTSVPGSPGVG